MKRLLGQIDEVLISRLPDVHSSLNSPAKNEDIELLLSKTPITSEKHEDILSLYRWHNGQVDEYTFKPEEKFSFLSIAEVIHAYQFFQDNAEDIQQPWSDSWVPLFGGSGDYIVYETADDASGKLIDYWHDEEDRPIESESIEKWLQEALLSIENYEPPSGTKAVWAYEKVNVLLVEAPSGGIKEIKHIKDTLSLPHGFGQLACEVKEGPVEVLTDKYYSSVLPLVQQINTHFDTECLAVFTASEPSTKLPTVDP